MKGAAFIRQERSDEAIHGADNGAEGWIASLRSQ
jgi:hypothetical protein